MCCTKFCSRIPTSPPENVFPNIQFTPRMKRLKVKIHLNEPLQITDQTRQSITAGRQRVFAGPWRLIPWLTQARECQQQGKGTACRPLSTALWKDTTSLAWLEGIMLAELALEPRLALMAGCMFLPPQGLDPWRAPTCFKVSPARTFLHPHPTPSGISNACQSSPSTHSFEKNLWGSGNCWWYFSYCGVSHYIKGSWLFRDM